MNERRFFEEYPMNIPIVVENVLKESECDFLIKVFGDYPQKVTTGLVDDKQEKKDVRNVDVINLFELYGEIDDAQIKLEFDRIIEKIHEAVYQNNLNTFNFDIDEIKQIEISRYVVDGLYKTHMDSGSFEPSRCRKVGFSITLNEGYSGGELSFTSSDHISKGVDAFKKRGSMILFPSYLFHEVKRVETGIRFALFGWAIGPRFK